MQALTKRMYVILTHTMHTVYTPIINCYFRGGDVSFNIDASKPKKKAVKESIECHELS